MYLTRYLKIDSVTAQQVNEARESYKAAVRQVMDNQALTAAQKREAIDILIDEKNKRLEQLLPEGQRQMIVPTTERRRGWRPDTTVRKTFK